MITLINNKINTRIVIIIIIIVALKMIGTGRRLRRIVRMIDNHTFLALIGFPLARLLFMSSFRIWRVAGEL